MSKSTWALSGFDVQEATPSTAAPDKGVTRNLLVHIAGNRAVWEHAGVHGGKVIFLLRCLHPMLMFLLRCLASKPRACGRDFWL